MALKERRPLVVLFRETPLHTIHIENMLRLSRAGAVLMPPVPSFYIGVDTLDEFATFTAVRALDQIGLSVDSPHRWHGEVENVREDRRPEAASKQRAKPPSGDRSQSPDSAGPIT